MPIVTVGLPVFNCEATLARAVNSILSQTYVDWELLILDDGSTDGTAQLAGLIRDSRVVFLKGEQNQGLPTRLNQAVSMGCGKYFARMDGDDVSYPDRLQRQVEYLEGHPEVDLVGAELLVFRGEGEPIGARHARTNHEDICGQPWRGFALAHPTWMGRMEWFRTNPYNPAAIRMEDQELLLRTHTFSRFAALDEILYGFREDDISLRKMLIGRKNYLKALASYSRSQNCRKLFVAGCAAASAKTIVGLFAVGSGLHHKILRHRAMPVSPDQLKRWAEVWNSLSSSDLITCQN